MIKAIPNYEHKKLVLLCDNIEEMDALITLFNKGEKFMKLEVK